MIKRMTGQEAAETAARAVAEAEFGITEAEEAAKEVDRAEAEAEAAQIYAKAAVKFLKFRISNHTKKEAIMGKFNNRAIPIYIHTITSFLFQEFRS
uniref:Uncharacterized protein n=1 Tax=Brassica oleracea var. oleracea TaxID=109376 RepID=A0A0D3ABV2_BRAOL